MGRRLVSVVTPSYNRSKEIKRAINTVSQQTYPSIEHIIVDDHSTTPVSDVIDEPPNNVHVYRHNKNKGANVARNTGIEISNGDYIAFLDDDDKWSVDKIERQIERAQGTSAGVLYTGVKQVKHGCAYATQTPSVEGKITRELLTKNPINSFSTVMIRSDIFDSVGLLDERLPNWQDWEFYIRASLETEFTGISEPLVSRIHDADSQLTSNYVGKKNVSAKIIREEYSDLAKKYGVTNLFNARIEKALGATAINADRYRAAQRHYIRSLRFQPTGEALVRILALIGGHYTYEPIVQLRRKL